MTTPSSPPSGGRTRRWLADTAGGLPREFWVLWCGTLVNRLGGFVMIFLALYLTVGRGFSPAFAGLVIGLSGAGGAVGVLVGGVLADRWGRRPTLFAGHLAAAASMLGLGLSSTAWPILGWGIALGVFSSLVRPAFMAMMVDLVPEPDRLRAFSLVYWAVAIGFSFAAALAGVVAQIDYLLLFVVDALSTLVMAVGIVLLVPETRPTVPGVGEPHVAAGPAGGRRRWRPRSDGLHTVFRDPVFLTFTGLTTLFMLVLFQHIVALPISMAQDGLPPTAFGVAIGFNGVLIVLGQLTVSRRIQAFRRSRMLAVAAVFMGVGFGLTAWADDVWAYALTVCVWTVGEMIAIPTASTVVAELAPPHLRGSYQGVYSLAFSAAAFAGPVAGGWVLQHLGSTTLWLACLAVGLLTAAGHLAAAPSRARRLAAQRAAQPFAAPPSAGESALSSDEPPPADVPLSSAAQEANA